MSLTDWQSVSYVVYVFLSQVMHFSADRLAGRKCSSPYVAIKKSPSTGCCFFNRCHPQIYTFVHSSPSTSFNVDGIDSSSSSCPRFTLRHRHRHSESTSPSPSSSSSPAGVSRAARFCRALCLAARRLHFTAPLPHRPTGNGRTDERITASGFDVVSRHKQTPTLSHQPTVITG